MDEQVSAIAEKKHTKNKVYSENSLEFNLCFFRIRFLLAAVDGVYVVS